MQSTPHRREKLYFCSEEGCNKAFYRSEHLSRHRLNHRPKKVFACTKCPKEFVRLDLLQRHQVRHEKGMSYRNVGGRVTPAAPRTTVEQTMSTPLHVASSSDPPLTTVAMAPPTPSSENATVEQDQDGPAFLDQTMDFFRGPVEHANSLFFDDSISLQDLPDDIDWLLKETALVMDPMSDTGYPMMPLAGPLQPLTISTPFRYIPEPALPFSPLDSSDWTTVRSRLLNSLCTLPSEILESDFWHPSNLAMFYDLYFENYNPHFPFLHRPTLLPTEVSPLLMAAILMLGSSLAPEISHYEIGQRLHDYLRWIIFSSGNFEPPAPLWCLQALLIIQAHAKMISTRKHHEMAHVFHGAVITMMKRGSAYLPKPTSEDVNSSSAERSWLRWVEDECARRTAFFAFLMDAQHSSLFGHTPMLSANDIRLPLPCQDSLWDCRTPELWQQMIGTLSEPPLFLPTLRALLGRTPIPSNCSAYARFVLLHGILSVITHLHARDLATLGIGANQPFSRESSTSLAQTEDWKDVLARSIDTWSFSLLSQTPSLCLEAARPLHRIAYVTLHCNIIDFHIVAGAPSLLGSLLSRNDYSKAKSRVRSWSEKEESKKALYHSLLLIQETVFTGRRYRAREDNIAPRPWCLYHATLILWAYGFMTEGRADESLGPLGAEEYIVLMLSTLATEKGRIKGANRTKGLITVVRECLAGCRWELIEEAYVTLGGLIGIQGS